MMHTAVVECPEDIFFETDAHAQQKTYIFNFMLMFFPNQGILFSEIL